LALVNKKSLPLSLVLAGSVVLAACSSKPSPWAESSSPWDSRSQQVEAEPVEVVETTEPVVMEVATVESMEMASVEAETMPGDEMAAAPVEPMYDSEPMPMPMAGEAMMVDEGQAMQEPMAMEAAPVTGSLSEQPAEYFVVQVVASSTMQQLSDFAKQNQMSDQWVAETTVDGKVWYVLMLGVYPTKAEADVALESVSAMDTQPWVRSVRSLQTVMN